MKLKKNQIISSSGKDFRILDLLGAGGQGEVYLAECEGHKYALKVYIDDPHPDFCYNLRNNIEKGSPSKTFIWPRTLVQTDDCFGYVMDLRPQNYVSFVSYLTGKNKFRDQATLLCWCIELCLSFKKLHEKGYSYQDLNDGSFFLDSDTGDLLICDNDNVTADKKNPSLWGLRVKVGGDILIKDEGGNEKTVATGGMIPTVKGLKIKFNDNTIGEIR